MHLHDYDGGCIHKARVIDEPGRAIRKSWRSALDYSFTKADENDNTSFEWLHRVADEASKDVIHRFLEAVRTVKSTVDMAALAAAMEKGNVDEVMRILSLDEHFAAALRPAITAPLEDVFIAAGRAAPTQTLAMVPPPRRISALSPAIRQKPLSGAMHMKFDISNPNAIRFIQNYDFGLIREVSEETRGAIRTVVLDAFQNGGHPFEQAKTIRNMIGLTQRQAQAVLNYRDGLLAEGADADRVAPMVTRYRNKLLNNRAINIARTETIRASNAGQDMAWQQAADKGLLDRPAVRLGWLVTPDDRLCPLCEAVPLLNPNGIPLGGMFQTPVGPVPYGPLHPQCRCTTYLIAF